MLLKFRRNEKDLSIELGDKSLEKGKNSPLKQNEENSLNLMGFPLKPKIPQRKKFLYYTKKGDKNQ